MAGCPSSHQPTRIREETLESGEPLQRKLNFRLRTYEMIKNSDGRLVLSINEGLCDCSNIGAFLKYFPQYCFVVEDESGICGYVVAANNVVEYNSCLSSCWLPETRQKYPLDNSSATTAGDADLKLNNSISLEVGFSSFLLFLLFQEFSKITNDTKNSIKYQTLSYLLRGVFQSDIPAVHQMHIDLKFDVCVYLTIKCQNMIFRVILMSRFALSIFIIILLFLFHD